MKKGTLNTTTFEVDTTRLSLRLIAPPDATDIFDYARDPKVSENTSWYAHENIEDSKAFIEYVIGRHNPIPGQVRCVWGISLKRAPKVIGTISFSQEKEGEGRIDYALSRQYWGKGITTEAAVAIVDWAFQQLPNLEQITSGCLSRNIGSVKVLQKAGFHISERYESHRGRKFNHQIIETTLFNLSRQQWQANQE